MGYNARGGHGYGGNSRHGSGSSHWYSRGKGRKNEDKVVNVREEEKPKSPASEIIQWQERPIPDNVQIILSKPTNLLETGVKVLLSNDLEKQHEIAYQISTVASTLKQKLGIEVLLQDGSTKKFKVISIVDQQPTDKPVSFADLTYIGNLRNQLRPNGFTVIPA